MTSPLKANHNAGVTPRLIQSWRNFVRLTSINAEVENMNASQPHGPTHRKSRVGINRSGLRAAKSSAKSRARTSSHTPQSPFATDRIRESVLMRLLWSITVKHRSVSSVSATNAAHHWRRASDIRCENKAESRRPVNVPGSASSLHNCSRLGNADLNPEQRLLLPP